MYSSKASFSFLKQPKKSPILRKLQPVKHQVIGFPKIYWDTGIAEEVCTMGRGVCWEGVLGRITLERSKLAGHWLLLTTRWSRLTAGWSSFYWSHLAARCLFFYSSRLASCSSLLAMLHVITRIPYTGQVTMPNNCYMFRASIVYLPTPPMVFTSYHWCLGNKWVGVQS